MELNTSIVLMMNMYLKQQKAISHTIPNSVRINHHVLTSSVISVRINSHILPFHAVHVSQVAPLMDKRVEIHGKNRAAT